MKDTTPSVGHNSTIEIGEGKYHAYVAAHADLDAEIEGLKAKRKKLRKKMRADGIRLVQFDAAQTLAAMKRSDVEDHFLHLKQYMTWNRHPIGTQFGLDLGEPQEGDFEDEDVVLAKAKESAIQEGFWAGITNKPMSENPHDDNTDAGQAWIQAWHDGQEKRAAENIDPLDDIDD